MRNTPQISISSWFSQGWKTYKSNTIKMIGGSVIWSLLVIFSSLPSITKLIPINPLIIYIFWLLIGPVLTIGWLYLCLRLVRGENIKILSIFDSFSYFGKTWTTYFLFFLIVLGGIILFVIPGIIWALRYGLSLFAVMDRQLSAKEAIRFSSKITKGFKGKLFITWLLSLFLSLLVTVPFIGLRNLTNEAGSVFLVIKIVYYLAMVFLTPLIYSIYAAAYNSLAYQEESSVPTIKTASLPLKSRTSN